MIMIMKHSFLAIKQCLGFRWFLVMAASYFVVSVYAATNNNENTSSPSPLLNFHLRKLRPPAVSSKKWLTARSDCTIQVISYLQDPDAELLAEDEEFVCELDASDVPGAYTGITRKLGLTDEQKFNAKNMWMDGRLTPGKTKLKISGMVDGVQFNSQEIPLPSGFDIMKYVGGNDRFVVNNNTSDKGQPINTNTSEEYGLFDRNLQSVSFGSHVGNKPMLVVKVTDVNGLAPDETPAAISDDVFGTSGDTINLKSQMNDCSMGRVTIIPGDNNSGKINQSVYSAPGVISVTIGKSLVTSTRNDIRNAVTTAVQNKLGVSLPGPYKNVIYVLEKCYTDCGWAAYGFVNGWNTVYVNDNFKYVGVLMHELGHNYGLVRICWDVAFNTLFSYYTRERNEEKLFVAQLYFFLLTHISGFSETFLRNLLLATLRWIG